VIGGSFLPFEPSLHQEEEVSGFETTSMKLNHPLQSKTPRNWFKSKNKLTKCNISELEITVPSHLRAAFLNVRGWVTSLALGSAGQISLLNVLDDAFKSADLVYGESEALEWAQGFSIPQSLVDDGVDLFRKSSFDIDRMIKSLKISLASTRLSVESINRVVSPNNCDYERMIDLVEGMPLFPSESFLPSSESSKPVKLSSTYIKMGPAVDKMLFEDFLEEKLAFVLPAQMVYEHVPKYHLSRLSWTSKVGKKKGRPILDCSAGDNPLNSDDTKRACDEKWGVIFHPTIKTFIEMIISYASQKDVPLSALILWKVDLKGAYTLLSFSDEEVPLVGALLSNENIIFFLCGVFGWTGTPASFQVVTRVIKSELKSRISGAVEMYVDDILGVSLLEDAQSDVKITTKFCCDLFNSQCIAESKTIVDRRIDVIGYTIDLDSCHVSVTQKNQQRVVYGLMVIDTQKSVTVKLMQRFASWISRYADIIPILKPFIRPLYSSFKGRNEHASFDLDDEMRRLLQIFRAIFLTAILDELSFTRNLFTFVSNQAQIVVEFDASLSGGGILYFDGVDGSYLGASTLDFLSLELLSESRFQNYAEFLVSIISIIGAIYLRPDISSIAFRGDSRTALSWLSTGRIKSDIASNLALIFVHLCIDHKISVDEVSHLPGESNIPADMLSRGSTLLEVRKIDKRINSNQLIVIPCSIFLSICNPINIPKNDQEFIDLWNCIPDIIHHMIKSTFLS
jgi:hypothetical protein